ncbi:hypothetical protein F66182_4171 [Fusarium sp. NRRL 66182]|nr:hypothetical protein F66182_4171 [Fusarium sp. NRRL 66182]
MKPSTILSFGAVLLSSPSTVDARQCNGPPCGRIENETPWAAKWADLGMTDHRCQLSTVTDPVKCKQFTLPARTSRGGFLHPPRTDVDAFCYANRGYYVRFGLLGRWQPVRAGVWIKIDSAQTAKCDARDGAPHCTVTYG